MPLDTLRMLADQLYTVLMSLVEGESFDIFVGSGSGEGLEARRRLPKRWDPLTTGRARGLLREILSPGRAKLVELQGAVERLVDLMRRYTQRRDARDGQRHTLAEDIRMAALEALLPEELERHCQLQRSRLDTYQKLREEVVLYAEARRYVAPKLGQVSKAREDKDDPMDVGGFGQWKGRNPSKGKERILLALAKEREQERMEKIVRNHQDERVRREIKISVGIGRKQVTKTRIAGDGRSNRIKDIHILLERQVIRKANQAKVVERKENPKMPEHLVGINSRVKQRAQRHRLHHRQKQAQQLVQLTRLSAQHLICARLH